MTPKTTAKDFFFHLAALVTLYTSFGALLSLLFDYVNYLYPDVLTSYYDPYSGSVRFSISLLLVIFPLYMWLMYVINKDLRIDQSKKDIWVRRWGLSLTVFLAAVIVAGDLITLLNTFLNGEITTRFILKVLIVLIVAGVTLWYYILDIRGKIIESAKMGNIFRIVAIVMVFGSIIGGFFIIGSPTNARNLRFDSQKVSDLQNIQSQIGSYYQLKQRMPKALSDLNNSLGYGVIPKDPQTGNDYEFTLGEGYSFKLCADFNRESTASTVTMPVKPIGVYGESENWQHPAGNYCFDRVLDPELYPPYPKN